MQAFDDKTVIEFLRRSYFAVDGAWFVRAEEGHSYEDALKLDEQVWQIMPKVQARKARELLGIEGGSLADMARALWLRFAAEGYEYKIVEQTPEVLKVDVLTCPWLQVLRKSHRESLAADICERICAREYPTWAAEFSDGIEFSLESRIPQGAHACRLAFECSLVELPNPEDELEAAG